MQEVIDKACEDHTEKCMQDNINPIMQEIKNLSEKLSDFKLEIVKEMANMPSKLEKKFDNKYADKHTEKDVTAIKGNISKVMWIVMTGVLIGVLNLILK